MKEIVNEVEEEKYKNDYSFLLEYDKEALDEEIRQDELKKAREESYNEGILCLANKLIKMNIPKEKIEKAIGMPLEKLEDPDYTDEIKIPTYDKEALHEGIRQDELKKAKEESYNEGTINEKREIAKKLLEMNIAKKDIEKAIGMLLENLLNN